MAENQTIKERLISFIAHLGIGQGRFEKICGLSNGYINNMRRSISPNKLQNITEQYPELNPGWLMTGEGSMLRMSIDSNLSQSATFLVDNQTSLVPLLPLSAQGGSLNEFAISVREQDCEKMISPIVGAELAIPVAGDSMSPEYPSGSRVLIKRINEKAFIDWGKVYVLDTENGVVIKKLMPSDSADSFRCVSINPDYPPFDVPMSAIHGVYVVLMCLCMK